MSRLATLRSALRLLRDQVDRALLLSIGASLLLVALTGTLAAASPLVLKHLVDAVDGHVPGQTATGDSVLWTGIAYLLVLLGSRVASDVRPLLTSKIEQRVLAVLRQRFFEHLLRLPMSYLIRRRGGELLHSVELAGAGGQLITSHLANGIAPVLVELAVMAVILVQLQQPSLVLLFLATALGYLAVFALGTLRFAEQANAVSAASLAVHAQLNEGIVNAEPLRCFGAERQALAALAEASARLAARWLTFNRSTVAMGVAASAFLALALAACLTIAAEAVAQGRMTLGGFVLANVYMLQMTRPLEALGHAARDVSRALGFMRPLLDILAQPAEEALQPPPRIASKPTHHPNQTSSPSIRLENLHFGYEPGRPVLCALDLDIAAGRTTAIVGRSGSGKSTLVRLLLRLHPLQSGSILIDGQPAEALSTSDLRALFGLVAQDCALLHASAADNIALGASDATPSDIELAARAAGLHHVIAALADGYDTMLGERGQTLSGGERQRLAIARALVRRPAIYILDEPTSMLDTRTEMEVMRSIRQVTAGRTTLVIAHRLSTVMHADEIVVLDKGRVHERGPHAALLAKGGLYAELWRQQAGASS